MLIRITIRNNIIAGAIFKILSRSFYAEILALQGFPAGLRDSYFIRDKSGYSEIQDNQTFSSAGKQRGFEDERYLWPEMLRVIRELHPSWVLGENVAGFIHLGLDKTVFDLEQAGYAVRVFVLPAVAVGAWHERKRTFIIGHTASHAPCQRHGGCGEDCRCADDPDRELPKIQPQRNRMDGAAVMGGLQTAGQPAGGCETESRLGGMADGIPPEMDGHSMWAKEPAQIPYLISDPPANVAKRLKTLGNAVVPPQVYPILRYIAEIETGRCRNRQGGDAL